ncbi:MAG: UxaA family hydrolase [Dehalococcoidales bacterium]|nr:UxaA family hydrolase [Dehalococcoidales bacterium]
MKSKAVVINHKDNVATALDSLKVGDTLELGVGGKQQTIKLASDIPFGHKFCLSPIEINSPIIKYGEIIGIATTPIAPGDYVHTHNVVSARGRGDLTGGTK